MIHINLQGITTRKASEGPFFAIWGLIIILPLWVVYIYGRNGELRRSLRAGDCPFQWPSARCQPTDPPPRFPTLTPDPYPHPTLTSGPP